MEYSIAADGYLARARAALADEAPQSLFYAAFELRCCIETRQAEYAEALRAYKGTKIKPWNIGENGKKIRKASYAEKICSMKYDFGGLKMDSYHTPVTDALIRFAEQELGSLLHCQTEYKHPNDGWWENVRHRLVEGYRMAWLACKGDSLTPPLWNKETKEIHPVKIEIDHDKAALLRRLPELVGMNMNVTISYLESPPADWKCEL